MTLVHKVSIILCVYNAEETLAATLESVLNQTYPHYELVAVDDGSTDSSADILTAYQPRFPQLKIIRQENQGPGPARNAAIAHAGYDLLAFIDSDDIWHKAKLETQLEVYEQHADAVCVISDCQEFTCADDIEELPLSADVLAHQVKFNNIFKQLAEINFNFQPMTALWDKSVFVGFGGFTDDRSGQDYYPFLVAALNDLAFYLITDPLYYVRVSSNSVSRSRMSPYWGAMARVKAIDRILDTDQQQHVPTLTAEKLHSLKKGRQKFLRWVLFGIRYGFPRTKMLAEYSRHIFRIRSKKTQLLEFGKLLVVMCCIRYKWLREGLFLFCSSEFNEGIRNRQ
jgi:glycosyltransferase involved in cell wall biosynthesis